MIFFFNLIPVSSNRNECLDNSDSYVVNRIECPLLPFGISIRGERDSKDENYSIEFKVDIQRILNTNIINRVEN